MYNFLLFFRVLLPFWVFYLGISNDAQCSESDFCIHDFFFVQFLIAKIWSILYSTVVNWGLAKDLEENFAKYAVDANQ